ncbi:uncharacterized protein [Aegilops tauschii subsp. strangulata]|uniref:uncharacterized protein n=1 Tax=Aegilops tauschii subsp. strangulata TaxID=200361 RepID=UPI003CC8610A
MSFEKMLDAPCKHHSGARPSTHMLPQCAITKRITRDDIPPPPAPAPGAGPPPPPPLPPPPAGGTMHDDIYPAQNATYVVFTSLGDDKRSERLLRQEVNTVIPAKPEYMHWSDRPVTWTREDHPTVMPNPGGYALVLDPTMVTPRCTCKFSQVLIDGGSSINVLYCDTMTKLSLKAKDLEPPETIFHDIMPGLSCSPIGQIWLDVLFGPSDHFRRESLWFEEVDLYSAYHALLGRPALAKFMAVPNYTYVKMKLPGPKGLITISGDYRKSLECAQAGAKLADSLVIAEERRQLDRIVALANETPAVSASLEECWRHLPTLHAEMPVAATRRNIHIYVDDIVLLGFLVSEHDIEANPEKIKAIEHMRKPARLCDVQKFTGCLASVGRFLNRLGERGLPLYQLMKKTTPFEWNDQEDEAFWDLKRMLSTAPVLAAPTEKEPLLLYITATSRSVSMVMVLERPEKGKIQSVNRPVYYPHYQKMCYGVYFIAKKLKQYFQEHVLTMSSGEWDARDANMASYHFLVQQLSGFFDGCEFLHVPHMENEAAAALSKIGSSRQSIPSGISLEHLHKPSVMPSPDSESIFVPNDPAGSLPDTGTAEPGPGAAEPNPGAAQPDSGTDEPYPGAATLNPAAVTPNPVVAASGSQAAAPEPAMVAVFAVVTAPSWALPISEFLENGVLPMDETEARQVQRRASAYNIINNELVKRCSMGVFQRSVEQDEGIEILLDIHQGECGHHAASRSLVAKAFRHGFYWPTTLQDAESLVLQCEGCQRFSKRNHQPASAL